MDKHRYHILYLESAEGVEEVLHAKYEAKKSSLSGYTKTHNKSETMTISKKHIDFAKDNLACITAAENDAENGYEAEDGDGET